MNVLRVYEYLHTVLSPFLTLHVTSKTPGNYCNSTSEKLCQPALTINALTCQSSSEWQLQAVLKAANGGPTHRN